MKKNILLKYTCILTFSIIFTALQCDGPDEENGIHTDIEFVNHSKQLLWLEWNPYFPMNSSDSIFHGFQIPVNYTFKLTPSQHLFWDNELKFVPFVRLFLFDAPYNSISNHPDSLRHFQDEHLIYMHWYTQNELDSLNWTIHYPVKE